mgnify:FL=1|jgi:hypothetical protein
MGLKEAAEHEAILKTIYEKIKAAYDTAREDTQRELDAAKETTGTTRVSVELDGAPLATTSRTTPKEEARVTDHELFLKWVRDTYPKEVVARVVTEVRTAFAARLLKEMGAAGTARVVDVETGELHDVPGIEVRVWRKATHSVRLADGAEQAIADAWQDGRLAHLGLPQLTAGGGA